MRDPSPCKMKPNKITSNSPICCHNLRFINQEILHNANKITAIFKIKIPPHSLQRIPCNSKNSHSGNQLKFQSQNSKESSNPNNKLRNYNKTTSLNMHIPTKIILSKRNQKLINFRRNSKEYIQQ